MYRCNIHQHIILYHSIIISLFMSKDRGTCFTISMSISWHTALRLSTCCPAPGWTPTTLQCLGVKSHVSCLLCVCFFSKPNVYWCLVVKLNFFDDQTRFDVFCCGAFDGQRTCRLAGNDVIGPPWRPTAKLRGQSKELYSKGPTIWPKWLGQISNVFTCKLANPGLGAWYLGICDVQQP